MADILAVHNTTPRRLRFANKLGGMPCPSIAYVNADHLYDSFGDISLICSPEMANPADRSLYVCDSDIYSGRFPPIFHSVDRDQLEKRLKRAIEISDLFSEDATLATRVIDFIERNTIEEAIFAVHRFPELFIQFEEEVFGKSFDSTKWDKKKPRYQCDLSARPRIQEWIKHHFEKNKANYIDIRSPDIEVLREIIEEEIDHLAKFTADKISEKATSNYMKNKDFDFFQRAFREDFLGSDKASAKGPNIQVLSQLERDYLIWSKDKPDLEINALEDYIKTQDSKVKAQFEQWMTENLYPVITKSFFYHETPSGNTVKKDFTLSNVTKSMKKMLRGGENFHYGAGNVRAQVATYFRRWRDIENRAGILKSEDEFELTKKELNQRYIDLIDELRPFYRFQGGNSFLQTDDISKIISEYAGGRNIALKEGFNVDEDFPMEKIDQFINDLREAPTQYFEGKFKRGVDLSEYTAAVIPKDTAETCPDILKILDDNKIIYKTYDPDMPLDRVNKTKEISAELNLVRRSYAQESLVSPKK